MTGRRVLVEGFGEDADEEWVTMVCENKRIGGGDVEEVQLIGNGAALVTFVNSSVAAALLAQSTAKISGLTLRISDPQSASVDPVIPVNPDLNSSLNPADAEQLHSDTLQVHALPSLPSEDVLMTYFESRRVSGGAIKKLTIHDDGQSATIVFKDPKVLWAVLKREHKVEATKLQVCALESLKELNDVHSCAVEANGIPTKLSQEMLTMFFESKRHTGGEALDNCFYDQSNGRAVLTYTSPQVALEVSNKQSVVLEGQSVQVRLLNPAPPPPIVVGEVDPNKLLAKYLPITFVEEDLADYLKEPSGKEILKVSRSRSPSVAMVVFSGVPDYIACRRRVITKPFLDRMISVQKVSLCTQIIVFPLVPSLSDDVVILHFESPRYGGGIIIDSCFHRDDGYVVITYEDRTAIDRVVLTQHSIAGHLLRVDYYNQDIGPPPEAVSSTPAAEDSSAHGSSVGLKQPEVITVSDVVIDCEPKKVAFMEKKKGLKEEMDKELAAHHCSVVWPEDSNSGTIVLKCTASTAELTKDFSSDDWTETCTNLVKVNFNRVLIGKLEIPEEIRSRFAKQALGLKDSDGDLMWEQSESGDFVQYVGSEESVENFTKQYRLLTKKLLAELQKENEVVTDVVDQVTDVELQLLRMIKFDEQNESQTLHINITDKAVNFQGTRQEVLHAKTKFYELINQETTCNYPAKKFKLTAFDDKTVIEYVKNSFRERHIPVVVASQKDKVVLSGLSQQDIDDAVKFLDSELIEGRVMLDDASVTVLTMPQWSEAISKLKSSFPVLVVDVSPAQDAVMCLSTKAALNKVVEEIEAILKSNIQTEQFLPASESKVKYINKFMTAEINKTENILQQARISITVESNGKESGVRVTGAPNGIATAMETVKLLVESVLSYNYTNDSPGVQKAFRTKRGKDSIDALEHRIPVIIEVKESFVTSSPSGAQLSTARNVKASEPMVKLEATLPTGIVIKVIKGDITKCKVDAIVIPCNDKLQPIDDLAKRIHDSGGSAIQDECKKHISVQGTLLVGRVFASKAGKLPVKAILHTVSPKWKEGKSKETEYLKDAVDNTLKEALSKTFESIAMPAISTGGSFGFQPASATSAIVEGIAEFFTDFKGQCCLKSIELVDSSDQVVNYFHDALKTISVSSIRLVGDDTVTPTARNVGVKSPVPPSATPKTATYSVNVARQALTTREGLTIALVLGAIAAQKVDVIVNTTSKEISFTAGAVSKSILEAAGPEIGHACTKASKGGRLKHDEIISTDPFKLSCKRVYHVACMGWDGVDGQCEKTTRNILSAILKRASNEKMSSIAIPAIGTGGLGLPRQLVAKMMYEEAIRFSTANPTTTLKEIYFVVYDKDDKTIAEFKKHLAILCSSTNLQDTPSAPPRNRTLKKGNAAGVDLKKPNALEFSSSQPAAFDFVNKRAVIGGMIDLNILQGDLTSQKTDAVVNCTNKELNLRLGAVAIAIAKAGGPTVIEECKKIGIMTNGVAVTRAGNIGCKYIIHLEAADDSGDWMTVIRRGLVEAEKLQLSSISYPLLGTGARGIHPSQMAVMFFHAVEDFVSADKPKHLKRVGVVIYERKMVDEFTKAIAKETGADFQHAAASPVSDHVTADAMVHGDSSNSTSTDLRTPVLSFSITAMSQKDIDNVIKGIEEVGNETMKDLVLENEQYQKMIARLTEDQMRRIQIMEKTDQVTIEIDKGKRINRIRIRGDKDDVTKAFEKITNIFHEAGRLAQQEMEAKLIAKEAQWEYNEGDQTYEAYPPNINGVIEKAFQEKKPFAKWEEEDGTYQIDFTSMLEMKENSAGSQVKVRRSGNIMIKYPETWEQMNDGETFKKVRLTLGTKECLAVEARIRKQAGDTIHEFISIHRIQNSTLYKQYAAKKQHMEVVYANAPKVQIERRLWHGTKEKTLEDIENYGFNRSYSGLNAGTVHGRGAYFAKEWGYSARDQYSTPNARGYKYIYQVAVLAGEFTQSSQNLFDAPLKQGSNVVKYDSVVDDVKDPQIFVIFSDHQAYPEYLIEFVPTTKSDHDASS